MQYITCNLCGADNTSLITTQNSYRMIRCNQCGLVYVNPRPTSELLIKMYNDYHQRGNKDEHTWAKLMEGNLRETAGFLNKVFPAKGKILDVGCGYGHFIEIMSGSGWTAAGIEPSARLIDYTKRKGLNVVETTIDDAVLPEKSFDAVTAFYVLEHIFDPLSALRKIFMLLKPGGVVILRVPHTTPIVKLLDFFGIKNDLYDMPFHLYDFSPKTVKLLLDKAGFTSIKVIPGCPTRPGKFVERMMSLTFGNLARVLFALSLGIILFPGTSKTVIAIKTK